MWKLLPQSWFNRRDPVFRRQVEAVELLQKGWREWLALAMSHGKPQALDAAAALQKLHTEW